MCCSKWHREDPLGPNEQKCNRLQTSLPGNRRWSVWISGKAFFRPKKHRKYVSLRIHGKMVYLPTWMVDSYGINVGKYTIHGCNGYIIYEYNLMCVHFNFLDLFHEFVSCINIYVYMYLINSIAHVFCVSVFFSESNDSHRFWSAPATDPVRQLEFLLYPWEASPSLLERFALALASYLAMRWSHS